jgi:hypothetical protein
MSIREMLLKEHSKRQTLKIAKYVGGNQERFDELMSCFFCNELPVNQRSAAVMYEAAVKCPSLVKKWIKKLVRYLDQPVHNALKRNTVRLFQFIEIPKSIQGITADRCFMLLNDTMQPVAVRAFSMTVLGNLARQYPELGNEIRVSLETTLADSSPGFRARARKVLKGLSAA